MVAAVESAAWTGKPPWHGLGTPVEKDISPRELQVKAGLDWAVEKVPLIYEYGARYRTSQQFALIRSTDGGMLDVVKSREWEPVQNDQAFAFFDEFARSNSISMDIAGALRGGQIVFVLAKMNYDFSIGPNKDDRTDSYLLFTNPHRYGQAVDIRVTPIRVVCMNTLSLALRSESKAKVRYSHRRKFDVEAAQSVFRESLELLDEYRQKGNFLAAKNYNDESLARYFGECFPYIPNIHTRMPNPDKQSKNAELAMKIVDQQPGAEFARNSWWSAYNAVTYLTDHQIGESQDTRLHSAWYGKGERRKRQALELALNYAKAA